MNKWVRKKIDNVLKFYPVGPNTPYDEINRAMEDLTHCTAAPHGPETTPVVITLRSDTVPAITVKLNTWKYKHSQNDTKEDFESHMQYFYDEHTCPTNWTREITEMSVGEDKDPHGIFEFVSAEDGHLGQDGELVPEAQEDQ